MADIDFNARYSVDGYKGVAFWLDGYAKEDVAGEDYFDGEGNYLYSDESEEVDNTDYVMAVMVGDNKRHKVDVDDLTKLDDLDYCASCGQIGCTHDGRERD